MSAEQEFSSMGTYTIAAITGDDELTRREAEKATTARNWRPMQAAVSQRLRRSLGHIACDVMVEAWSDTLAQIQERKDEFRKQRGERPSTSELLLTCTKQAVWRLEQRERRYKAKFTSWDPELAHKPDRPLPSAAAADFPLAPDTLSELLHSSWDELIAKSAVREQKILRAVGPVAVMVGNWDAAVRLEELEGERTPIAPIVKQLRAALYAIVEQRSLTIPDLSKAARRKLLEALFPEAGNQSKAPEDP